MPIFYILSTFSMQVSYVSLEYAGRDRQLSATFKVIVKRTIGNVLVDTIYHVSQKNCCLFNLI